MTGLMVLIERPSAGDTADRSIGLVACEQISSQQRLTCRCDRLQFTVSHTKLMISIRKS